jgi:hypothetical protein
LVIAICPIFLLARASRKHYSVIFCCILDPNFLLTRVALRAHYPSIVLCIFDPFFLRGRESYLVVAERSVFLLGRRICFSFVIGTVYCCCVVGSGVVVGGF